MGMSTYRKIKKARPKELEALREGLRKILVNIFEQSGRADMAKFARTMGTDSLEVCLHLGFSEKAFVQSLSGVVEETPFIADKRFHYMG